MHATCATMNQVVTNVMNMLECYFGGGHYKEVRVYFLKFQVSKLPKLPYIAANLITLNLRIFR